MIAERTENTATEETSPPAFCLMGGSTKDPCRRRASVDVNGHGLWLCAYHAAQEPLWRHIDDLHLAAALIEEELADIARRHKSAVLEDLLQRARADFSERAEFLSEYVEAMNRAERRADK